MKSTISNSEILTYLRERKKSLKKELAQVEKVLSSMPIDEKPSSKKVKKKSKKKLEKAVKAIRQKVSKATEGVKSTTTSVADTAEPKRKKDPVKSVRKPHVADKPANASAVTTIPAVVAEEKKPTLSANGTMDEKICYALSQKRNRTKEELIEYLHGLAPDYGLSKLRKVVAFRLTYLLKTGKIKRKEGKAGIRYR